MVKDKEKSKLKEKVSHHGEASSPKTRAVKEVPYRDYEALKKQLKAKEAEAAEYLDHLKHLQAEFENYKKRMVKEQTRFLETATQDLVSKLLPILDDFERSLSAAEEADNCQQLAEGVYMVYNHLKEVLAKEGLEEINPHGKEFNPLWHEAVMQEVSGEHKDNTVLEVLQKGYALKGKCLRPARVKVSKK